jgi:hypothetical protein
LFQRGHELSFLLFGLFLHVSSLIFQLQTLLFHHFPLLGKELTKPRVVIFIAGFDSILALIDRGLGGKSEKASSLSTVAKGNRACIEHCLTPEMNMPPR